MWTLLLLQLLLYCCSSIQLNVFILSWSFGANLFDDCFCRGDARRLSKAVVVADWRQAPCGSRSHQDNR